MNELTSKLEGLIEAQAMSLADQHLHRGKEAAGQIQAKLNEHLGRLQDSEEQRFQLESEQLCRQLIQGARLRLDAETDRLRWALAQEVLSGVRDRLEKLPADRERYRNVLVGLIAEAAQAMPAGNLVAEFAARDVEWLRADWKALADAAAPGRNLQLRTLESVSAGGVRVTDEQGGVRIDNTFEGRMARMETELLGQIIGALFADKVEAGSTP